MLTALRGREKGKRKVVSSRVHIKKVCSGEPGYLWRSLTSSVTFCSNTTHGNHLPWEPTDSRKVCILLFHSTDYLLTHWLRDRLFPSPCSRSPIPSPWFLGDCGEKTPAGLCSPQLHLSALSTLWCWCQETCKQDQTRTEPLRNAKATENFSYLLFFFTLSLFAVFDCACMRQNHPISRVQHPHPAPQFRVLQRGREAQCSPQCEVLCLRPG